jgi:hypothetical protein
MAGKKLLKDAALKIRSIQNGHIRIAVASFNEFHDDIDHLGCFIFLIGAGYDDHLLAAGLVRPQALIHLAFIMFNQILTDLQNLRGGTIIDIEDELL